MARKFKTRQYTGTVEGAIDGAKSDIDCLKDEMSSWKDNMEENLSHTQKYDEVSECCDVLETIHDKLEEVDLSDLPGDIANQEITYTEFSPYGRKPMPRWMRLSNAQSMIDAAKSAIETARDDAENDGGECGCDEPDGDESEYGDHHEVDCPRYLEDGEEREETDWDTPIDALDEATSECDNVNFPGMY